MCSKNGILLETGTGEMEVLEFKVGESSYSVNVIKVREILDISSFNCIPKSHPAILGIANIRGEVIPLIDMSVVLSGETKGRISKFRVLFCEFNHLKVAFVVDKVCGIHRVTWDSIKKPDGIIDFENTVVIGNLTLRSGISLMLDFEKIVTDIAPATGISMSRIEDIAEKNRSNYNLVLSDDSTMIRRLLRDVLNKAGIGNMKFFNDGRDTWNYLKGLADRKGTDFRDEVDVIITDIEMPNMDGHTLTRKIKESSILNELPVVIFSSLITDDLKHKGESVKADAQMSKPEVGRLVEVIDTFLESKRL